MGKRCCVDNCKSRYTTARVSLFTVPAAKVERWQELLPELNSKISSKDVICSKHFEDKYIQREVATTLYSYKLSVPRLAANALPTIFSDYDKRVEPEDDESSEVVPEETEIEDPTFNPESTDSGTAEEATDPLEISQEELGIPEIKWGPVDHKALSQHLFHHIWNDNHPVALPSKSWALHRSVLHTKMLIFSEMVPSIDNSNAHTSKKLIVTPSTVKLFVYERLIEDPPLKIEPFTSLEQLEGFLKDLHLLHACPGVKKRHQFLPEKLEFRTYVEDSYLGVWRHVNCSYLMESKTCKKCRNFSKALLYFISRPEGKDSDDKQCDSTRRVRRKRSKLTVCEDKKLE